MARERVAVLVIGRSNSWCSNCLEGTLLVARHDDTSGYQGKKGGGCGARFVAKATDNAGTTMEELDDWAEDLGLVSVPYEIVKIGAKL